MAYFDSGGVSIAFEMEGEGRPVVLVHGFASSFQRNWKNTGWVDFLTQRGFQVIGPDVRAHGRSEKFYRPEDYTTAILSGDILSLMDHLRVARADLIGYSMGGGIVLQLAMDHPERVRTVVVGGIADSLLPGSPDAEAPREIAAALEADDPAAIAGPMARLFRDFAEKGGGDLRALAAMMRGPGWPGHLEPLRPVACPVLIVTAGQDEIMAGAERLLRAIPHARLVTIPDRNHNTVVGDPRFKEAALQFLTG
jgi:pimeloyl-ACP methyl ester carboxylesterase